MNKLSKKEYWDSVYKDMESSHEGNKLKGWIKNQTRDYSNFLFWDVLFPKYLPKEAGMKIIEVGCAPGKYILNFKNKFGYDPYGVEYSKDGVELTRRDFESSGLNTDNIIEADFFDENFQKINKENFDLVFSRGFIEHFDDAKNVVEKHLNLIKKEGYIIISIPNISGINKLLAKLFNIDSYNLHNISIMNRKVFGELFSSNIVDVLYCDYVGIFSFGLFNTNKKWKFYLYRILLLIQRPFDFVLRLFFKNNILKSRFSSPYILFIGKKKC